jgi:hypothetical protein
MPATWSTFQAALKETWTQDDFETQFYDNHPLLEDIEKTDKHTIGEYANVPLELTRSGGFTVTGTAGSSALNAAGNAGVAQAQYALAFNYQQVKVDHPAIVTSQGNANAVATGARHRARVRVGLHADPDQPAGLPGPVGPDLPVRVGWREHDREPEHVARVRVGVRDRL